MTPQTLTIEKHRFVLLPERDYLRLQKHAAQNQVHPDFAQEAQRELQTYRKTGKAAKWTDVQRKRVL